MININKIFIRFFICLFFFTAGRNFARAEELSAEQLLARSDKERNMYYENAEFDLIVTSFKQEVKEKELELKIYNKGGTTSLVRFLAPIRDYGKKLLMLDEYLWFYIPGTIKPIRISPQQKMMGQVSYADAARTNFSADYTADLMGIEEIEGQEVYKLKLTAKRTSLSYQVITYYMNKSDYFPVSAVFHAMSGKPMKKSLFYRKKDKKNEYQIKIISLINENEYSILDCSNFIEKKIPDRFFDKNFLKYNE